MVFSKEAPKNFLYNKHVEFWREHTNVTELCASWIKGEPKKPLPKLLVQDCNVIHGLLFEQDNQLDSTATKFFAQVLVFLPDLKSQTQIFSQNRGIHMS